MTEPAIYTDPPTQAEKTAVVKTNRKARRVSLSRKFIAVLVVLGVVLGGLVVWSVAYEQPQQNRTIIALEKSSNKSQNDHHKQTLKVDDELKATQAALSFEAGVIVYQNGEIINAQAAGHQTLMTIVALQSEVKNLEMLLGQDVQSASAALVGGQREINVYLNFLTQCMEKKGVNCGTAPPLPAA